MAKEKPKNVEKQAEQRFSILTAADTARGVYSNVAVVQHSRDEFVIDFLFRVRDETQLVSRVVLSPKHMQAFRDMIIENVEKYENMLSAKQG